jgi:hypothetical protein
VLRISTPSNCSRFSSFSSLVQLATRLYLVFDTGEDLRGQTVTKQLVDAALAAHAGSGAVIDIIPTEAASSYVPSSCAAAFDSLCSHALTLLLDDRRKLGVVPAQPHHCIFDVVMRSVTVSCSRRSSLTCVSLLASFMFRSQRIDDMWNIVFDLLIGDFSTIVSVGDISGIPSIRIHN